MAVEVKLPHLGEGIESGDVLQLLVHEGDVVVKDQGIVELETDKATVEVPSSFGGKVIKVHIREGQTVSVGATLLTLEVAQLPGDREPEQAPSGQAELPPATAAEPAPEPAAPAPVAPAPVAPSPPKRGSVAQPPAPSPAPSRVRAESAPPRKVQPEPAGEVADREPIPAGPAVRRFAREVGVDLRQVSGSGLGGRITREDVLKTVRQTNRKGNGGVQVSVPADIASDAWGPVRLEKMSKIRKTIAAKMHESWTSAPRVTNFDDADVTELENFRQSSKADYAEKGIKLTTMPFVLKAVAMALQAHPVVNASLDLENEEIVYKQYVNIGIAVDTPRGLVVPSLRGVDRMSIPEIARGLATIAQRVRSGDFTLDELRGSTFTVSNLGAIGGTYSTPIINVPEVAILLVGRARKLPVVVKDRVVARLMMPLSLSYDHRLVDGAAAARFLNEVIGYLKAPSRLLLAP